MSGVAAEQRPVWIVGFDDDGSGGLAAVGGESRRRLVAASVGCLGVAADEVCLRAHLLGRLAHELRRLGGGGCRLLRLGRAALGHFRGLGQPSGVSLGGAGLLAGAPGVTI